MYVEYVIVLYCWVLFLSIFTSKYKKINKINYVFCFVLFFIIAGFRPAFADKDNDLYRNAWNYAFYGAIIEPSFVFIRDILRDNLKLSVTSLFVTYAFIGVITKFIGIKKLTNLLFLTLLAYLSHYYLLHDNIQIRASIASGFFLISLPFLYQRSIYKYVICILIGCVFHYSSFFLFFLYFLNPQKKQKIFIYLIPIGYLIYFLGANIIVNIPIPYFQEKLDLYIKGVESGEKENITINVFNAFILIKILLFSLLYYFQDKLVIQNKYTTLLLKINAISLAALPALSVIPAIAYRVHELYGVVEIILLPLVIYIFRYKFIGFIFVVIYTLCFLLVNIFYNELIFNPH